MSAQEVLVLAMTHMRSGICVAGLTTAPDPVSGLRWVRPVKEHGTVRLGDMTDEAGRVAQCSDVVELELVRPRPQPPHTEDVLTDFVYHRPTLLRRLQGERRQRFFAAHLDKSPEHVLIHQSRSLCLVHPDEVWASFALDPMSEKYQARMGFRLGDVRHEHANSRRGVPVTEVKWRALGREWMCASPGELELEGPSLAERLNAAQIYLGLGLSRGYEGRHWLMVTGVHVVPDYDVTIDYGNP